MFRYLTGILFLWILMFFQPLEARQIHIEFDQIEQISEERSPEWLQLEYRLDASRYGEEAAAMPLNPSISYDLEFLDNGMNSEYEQFLYLEKEFRTPGHIRNLRSRRDRQIEVYEQEYLRDRHEWLTESRMGFIRIVLAEEELAVIEELNRLVERFLNVLNERALKGETSLIDEQLLKMSSYTLRSRIEERELEKKSEITGWKNRMGFTAEDEIHFEGEFHDRRPILPSREALFEILPESPQSLTDRLSLQSAQSRSELEQSRRWPSFSLNAGYKQLNPDYHGFLVGISLPLPFLNRNQHEIRQARVIKRMEENVLVRSEQERIQSTIQIMDAIQTYEENLDEFPDQMSDPETFLRTLEAAYEEGDRSLSEVLNALNLMADSYRSQFEQLESYYRQITRLEAMTGQTFILSQ